MILRNSFVVACGVRVLGCVLVMACVFPAAIKKYSIHTLQERRALGRRCRCRPEPRQQSFQLEGVALQGRISGRVMESCLKPTASKDVRVRHRALRGALCRPALATTSSHRAIRWVCTCPIPKSFPASQHPRKPLASSDPEGGAVLAGCVLPRL